MNEAIYEALQEFPELRKNLEVLSSSQRLAQIDHEREVQARFLKLKQSLLFKNMSEEEILYYCKRTTKRIKIKKIEIAHSFPKNKFYVSGIGYNKNLSVNELKKILKYDLEKKFHPEGCDTIRYIFDHELGHQLDDLLEITNDQEIVNLYNEYIDKTLKTKEEQYKKLTNALSEYAWKNKNEIILREATAEAWAEYKNNPNPRKIAKKVGERMKQKYKEKFKSKIVSDSSEVLIMPEEIHEKRLPDPPTPAYPPQCYNCKHYLVPGCLAFQEIPDDIFYGEHDHRTPYPGDNGIMFEPRDPTNLPPD